MFRSNRLSLGVFILITAVIFFSPYVYASDSVNGQKEERRLITISQGIELVLKNNRMIKSALPDNSLSFQDSLLARSALLPQLSANISKTYNRFPPQNHN